ncbi:MAG TPA: DCC1-like thiol-disulfide oxidoreductase family protein, partial [Planctomycetota bacterium]|nr:DCC1-like thiol-disulfide oxidoreductase family protein [Planctomycetota bacterium]
RAAPGGSLLLLTSEGAYRYRPDQGPERVFISSLMSVGLMVVQVTFPLVLFVPSSRWFYIPAAMSFHLLALPTMATGPFASLWLMLVFLVPLDKAPGFLQATWQKGNVVLRLMTIVVAAVLIGGVMVLYFDYVPVAFAVLLLPVATTGILALMPGARADVFFDGTCRLTRIFVALLAGLDWARRLRLIDLSGREDMRSLQPRFDGDPPPRMCVVTKDGRFQSGFEAFRSLSWRLPLLVPLAPWLLVLPVADLGRRTQH